MILGQQNLITIVSNVMQSIISINVNSYIEQHKLKGVLFIVIWLMVDVCCQLRNSQKKSNTRLTITQHFLTLPFNPWK